MTNKNKITIAIDARETMGNRAGKGRYIYEIVRNLSRIDHTNHYILYVNEPIDYSVGENFKVVVLPKKFGIKQFWLAWHAYKAKCQVLFAPTAYLPVLFSFIPSVVTVHDLAIFIAKESRPAFRTKLAETLLLKPAAWKAKKVIAVSESGEEDIQKILGLKKSKIATIQEAYDKEAFFPKSPQTTDKDKVVLANYNLTPHYLLFIGTLEPRKNVIGLLTAYSQLSNELRHAYPLVIGGKKGWFYEEIFAKVKELNLTENVQFLGRVPDEYLPALYRNAKIFIFPSFYEGFGLPPLEAIACGTPAITSNISSLPEAVGEAGVLINPRKPEEITQTISELLTNASRYNTLVSHSNAQAAKFDWEHAAKETLEVLTSVASEVD